MKFSFAVPVLICFLSSHLSFVIAQECKIPPNSQGAVLEKIEKRNSKDYEGWKKFNIGDLSFYAPNDVKDNNARCYDGGCNSFSNNEIHIGIDRNSAAFYPRFHRSYPGYSEKAFCINGHAAWYWSYPSNYEKDKYHAGVFFYFEGNYKRRLVISINYKGKDLNQVAEKIIKSVEIVK